MLGDNTSDLLDQFGNNPSPDDFSVEFIELLGHLREDITAKRYKVIYAFNAEWNRTKTRLAPKRDSPSVSQTVDSLLPALWSIRFSSQKNANFDPFIISSEHS